MEYAETKCERLSKRKIEYRKRASCGRSIADGNSTKIEVKSLIEKGIEKMAGEVNYAPPKKLLGLLFGRTFI